MKPDLSRFLEVAAGHVLLQMGPALPEGYERSTSMVLGVLLVAVREEHERAAARRAAENAALRGLFSDALARGAVQSRPLRTRLEEAARGADPGLAVSELERENAALRGLLIELHAHVEELEGPGARAVEDAIWRELVESTERRRLPMGPF